MTSVDGSVPRNMTMTADEGIDVTKNIFYQALHGKPQG